MKNEVVASFRDGTSMTRFDVDFNSKFNRNPFGSLQMKNSLADTFLLCIHFMNFI
jgi:hypothetical protein